MARPSLQSRADEAIGLLALLYGCSEISGLLGGLSVLSEGTACPLEAMLARVRAELTAEIPGCGTRHASTAGELASRRARQLAAGLI